MSNTTPTTAEVEALAEELSNASRGYYPTLHGTARWILDRFVRREEHVAQFAVRDALIADLQRERDKLRTELKVQRCDGRGYLSSPHVLGGAPYLVKCPSCPACKPDATPKGDGGQPTSSRWAKAIAAADPGRDECDGGRTPKSVSTAEHQASELGASRADSAAPVVHVVNPPKCYCVAYYQPDCLAHKPDGSPLPASAPVNYCPECDGVLGRHVDWCSLAAPVAQPFESRTPEGVCAHQKEQVVVGGLFCLACDQFISGPAGPQEQAASGTPDSQLGGSIPPAAPVSGCPRHAPYWCYPCDDCSEALERKHTAESAAPVLADDEQWQLDAAERDKKRAADELRRWRYRIAIARFIDRRARPGDSTPERDAMVAVYEANVLLAELARNEEK